MRTQADRLTETLGASAARPAHSGARARSVRLWGMGPVQEDEPLAGFVRTEAVIRKQRRFIARDSVEAVLLAAVMLATIVALI